MKYTLKSLLEKYGGNATLRRPRRRWVDVRMDRCKLVFGGEGGLGLSCEHGNEPSGFVKGGQFLD
jgi:hypothetical protein